MNLNFKALEDDLAVLKMAMNSFSRQLEGGAPKIKVLESKIFKGSQSSKELEIFLWDVEHYFKAPHISPGDQVMLTSMYLTKYAKLWWHNQVVDDASAVRPNIETFESLKND